MPSYRSPSQVELEGPLGHRTLDVRCAVLHMSFSAHADAVGIAQLVRQTQPRHVVLVHGERQKMYVSPQSPSLPSAHHGAILRSAKVAQCSPS